MRVAPEEILEHWFGGHDPDDPATGGRQSALWWGHDEQTDQRLRERFGATHEAAADGQLHAWTQTPAGQVALVLVLDQLSRNLHRGTPRAFALDPVAQRLTLDVVERGQDRDWPLYHRVFVYMPLMHSERLADQERCCQLFDALLPGCEGARRDRVAHHRNFAQKHRDIVARFGRFPHRNATLGRPSSAEEERFLERPGSSF